MSGSTPLLLPYSFMVWTGKKWKSNCDRSSLYSGRDGSVHPNFVMAPVVRVLVRSLVLSWRSKMSDIFLVGWTQRRQAFRLLSASTQQSEFSVVPKGIKYTKISLSSQTRRTIINFGWKVVSHPPCIPDHLPSDYQLLGPLKNADEDIIMPMMGQCGMPSTSGCRRGRVNYFWVWIHVLVQRWKTNVHKDGYG
jgi:hypothetical protein